MLKNLVAAEPKTLVEYVLEFTRHDGCSGFSFPCDKTGKPDESMNECAKKNLALCMDHPEEFSEYNAFRTRKRHYMEPAHGTCTCGREVLLVDQYCGACECECGRWYNLFGQELLRPEYWGSDLDYEY